MTTTGDVYGGHPVIDQHPVMSTGFKPQIRNTVESSTRAIPDDPLYSSYRSNPIIPEIGQQNRVVTAPPDTGKEQSQHVLESMTKLMKKPPTDIEKFDGDALLYRRFVRQFNNYIGAFCENDYERLTYLEQFTSGEAHRVVMGYTNLDSSTGYAAAMKELNNRYGNEEVIASAYVQKALNWPVIKISDVKALDEYSIFLRECLHAIEEVGALGVLEYQGNLKAMVERLPYVLHDRWRTVVESRISAGKRIKFTDLVDFVSLEARKARNPIYGRDVLKCPTEKDSTKVKKQNRQSTKSADSRSLATKAAREAKKTPEKQEEDNDKQVSCISCSGNHDLDACKEFQKKPLEERQKWIKSKGICFGCLEQGHLNKNCQNRKKCRECQKRHPTAFHDFYEARKQSEAKNSENQKREEKRDEQTRVKESDAVISLCMNSSRSNRTTMAVPVYVSHKSNPLQEKLVYALLDTQSEKHFVSNTVCADLGIEGIETHLELSTMSSDITVMNCRRVTGLTIRGYNCVKKIAIPTAYTHNSIPVNRDHIPSRETAKGWKHLEKIAQEMLPKANYEIGLLVGYECEKAFEPVNFIPACNEGPFAVKTDLGWSIIGRTSTNDHNDDDEQGKIIHSHRIVTKETIPNAIHHRETVEFSVKTTNVKEVINPRDIIKVLESDFIERKEHEKKPISYEDKKFLDILSEGIHVRDDSHFEMPLPFKEPHPRLPNNKKQAEIRLLQLKRRLGQSENFGRTTQSS